MSAEGRRIDSSSSGGKHPQAITSPGSLASQLKAIFRREISSAVRPPPRSEGTSCTPTPATFRGIRSVYPAGKVSFCFDLGKDRGHVLLWARVGACEAMGEMSLAEP